MLFYLEIIIIVTFIMKMGQDQVFKKNPSVFYLYCIKAVLYARANYLKTLLLDVH